MPETAATYQPVRPFLPHQEPRFRATADLAAHAYIMDPGTGKTKLTMDTARLAVRRGLVRTVVVIALTKACPVWRDSVEDDWGPQARYRYVRQRSGSRAADKAIRDGWTKPSRDVLLWVVNQELLASRSQQVILERMMQDRAPGGTLLVVDEFHGIKSPSAKRTKAVLRVAKYANMRRILSATPLGTGWEDLFAPFAVLDPLIINCPTYTEFRHRYCNMAEHNRHKWIVGYRNLADLEARVRPHITECSIDELGLPEPLHRQEYVDLSPEQARAYEDLRVRFETDVAAGLLDDPNRPGLVAAELITVRLQRMLEVLSGFLRLEDGTIVRLPCPRVDAVVEYGLAAKAAGQRLLVWARWREDVERLVEALRAAGVPALPFYGKDPEHVRLAHLAEYKAKPGLTALVATPAAMAESYTVNEPHTVVWFSQATTLQRMQAMGRTRRIGQTKVVDNVDLLAAGTLDARTMRRHAKRVAMVDVLRGKATLQPERQLTRQDLLDLLARVRDDEW